MKKKILHIIESLTVGGAERLLIGMLHDLKDWENHLIILHDPETLKSELPDNVHFTNLHITGWKQVLTRAGEIKKYIRKHKIDIVHSHLYRANIMARLGTPKNTPLINSIHAISSLASYKVRKETLWLEKLTYRKRHHILAVSKEVLKDFDQWVGLKGKGSVLYNFIEDRFFTAPKKSSYRNSSLRLVAVGNLRQQKNYPYLVEAFRYVPEGTTLDIYGEGHMREELQKTIDEHNLNVRLCGIRSDMQNVLHEYDLFVMTSFYEGQPVALLEATVCGLPALLSDVPVLREIGGENAIYVNIGDVHDFAKKISEVNQGKYDLEKMAANEYDAIASFSSQRNYINKLNALYEVDLSS